MHCPVRLLFNRHDRNDIDIRSLPIIKTMSSHSIPGSLMRRASGLTAEKLSADLHFVYRQVLLICLALFFSVLLFILAALFFAAPSGAAEPVPLSDAELANVTGQAGISIYTSIATRYTSSVMKYSDTEPSQNWIEFQNVTVDDGSGGYYLIESPSYDEVNTLDIGTNDAGRTLVSFKDYSRVSPRWYHVENFVFCNQSLGSLHLDALSMGPSLYHAGAHADGTGGGYDFDYSTRVSAQAFRYTYNTTGETLNLSGIHLVGQATGGAVDNPADPSTWAFTGADNVFRIGDIGNGNPAKIDVVTDATGVTSLYLNLPMQGSLRVENVAFGPGNNFGPIAIDGINVHRLSIELRPGI